jgi:hypothetical protein
LRLDAKGRELGAGERQGLAHGIVEVTCQGAALTRFRGFCGARRGTALALRLLEGRDVLGNRGDAEGSALLVGEQREGEEHGNHVAALVPAQALRVSHFLSGAAALSSSSAGMAFAGHDGLDSLAPRSSSRSSRGRCAGRSIDDGPRQIPR